MAQDEVTLAFYKGFSTSRAELALGIATRLLLWSRISHVELILKRASYGETVICLSASKAEDGVRAKAIKLDPSKWVLVHTTVDDAVKANNRFSNWKGEEYNLCGALLSPFRLPFSTPSSWGKFCSQTTCHALGYEKPWQWTPARLYRHLKRNRRT